MVDRRVAEGRARRIGTEILERMTEWDPSDRHAVPACDPLPHWLGTSDEGLRTLLRQITRLTRQGEASEAAIGDFGPFLPADFLPHASPDARVKELVDGLLRRFTAGTTAREAFATAAETCSRGSELTLDVLGEAVSSEEAARFHRSAYREVLENPDGWPHRPNVSIKLSSLCARLRGDDLEDGLRRCAPPLREVLDLARKHSAFVNVDMERRHHLDMTMAVFRQVLSEDPFRECSDVSLVVQCYLVDALDRLRHLRDWARERGTPIHVRLVKGAYWAQERRLAEGRGEASPVHLSRDATDACHEDALAFVVENGDWLRPLVASHNPRTVAWAMACVEEAGRPRSFIEFQGLRGFGKALRRAIVAMAWPVREYTPFGPPSGASAYLTRRIQEALAPASVLPHTWGPKLDAPLLLRSPHHLDEEVRP